MLEVDFNRQDFARPLLDSGFDRTKPAFFLLEGVVSYLSKEGVDMTLKSIRMLSAPGSRLLFTYVHGGLLDGSINLSEMGRVPATLRKTGENWTFGIYPEELSDYLAKRGFKLLEDLDSTEWTTRYVGTSGPHQNDLGLYRGAVAEPASGESHSNAVNNSDQLEENSK
jgi:methyltransferase (TIGR00027 family)